MKKPLSGDEGLSFDGMPTGKSLSDFWRWSSSDLLNNTLRGAYAEFIVASALDLNVVDSTREDWTPFDLLYHNKRIEVKSAAYLQAWGGHKQSFIQFSIRPTQAWYPETGYEGSVERQSDLYIFCLYTVRNPDEANPLLLDGWDFYVLPTYILNNHCGEQKSISLASLLNLHPIACKYDGVSKAADALLGVLVSTRQIPE